MSADTRRRLQIVNIKGLHARASAKLAEVADGHEARAVIRHDGAEADADSIMGLLMLAASKGSFIEIETSGPDATALADAIERLVADRFGEPD